MPRVYVKYFYSQNLEEGAPLGQVRPSQQSTFRHDSPAAAHAGPGVGGAGSSSQTTPLQYPEQHSEEVPHAEPLELQVPPGH
mmetsp:Transcript_16884/g.35713  ORF Transcript_16884/g.35713 Transcript_16884/m.35713 type:complete len:82 (-) Transcript_16884:675-920(-)